MSIKIVEFKDLEGDTMYVNPAGVVAITAWRCHCPEAGKEVTVANIVCMGYGFPVKCSVEVAKARIWG